MLDYTSSFTSMVLTWQLVTRLYSETLPYDHLVFTAILFWPKQKLSQSLSYLKNSFNPLTPMLNVAGPDEPWPFFHF